MIDQLRMARRGLDIMREHLERQAGVIEEQIDEEDYVNEDRLNEIYSKLDEIDGTLHHLEYVIEWFDEEDKRGIS